MKIKPLTQKQYIFDHKASCCPVCKSDQVGSEDVGTRRDVGMANCQCYTCGSYWVDIWHLVRYENLNEGMTADELKRVENNVREFQKKQLTSP